MADQIQQVVSDIPQWMRDLMFGSKPAGMSDAEWNSIRAGGFQGLIPSAYSAAAGMRSTPQQQVAGLDPLTYQAQATATNMQGQWAPYLTSAQGAFGTAAQRMGAGQQLLDRGVGAAAQFPGAYSTLGSATGQVGLAGLQTQDALAAARGTVAQGIAGLSGQDVRLNQLPAQARNNLIAAAAAFNPQMERVGNEALRLAGVSDRQLQQAVLQAGGDTDQALRLLQQQGVDLNRLPADVRNRLTTAAQAQAQRLGQLDTQTLQQTGVTQSQLQQAVQQAGGDTAQALRLLQQQGVDLNRLPADVRNRLTTAAQAQAQRLGQLDTQTLQQAGATQRQTQEAIERSRGIAGLAAGRLLGTGAQFDPESTQAFMDPYRREVVEAQQQEMQRLADIQRQSIRAQAAQSGALGGSREAVQQAELTRNLVDQQSRLSAELMSQGYTQAQANAMAAFEQAQQRQLQGAAQAGQIGLSAEQLAAQTQLAGGQMGMQASQQAMQNAQFLAQQGMSAEQIAAQTGLTTAQIQQAGITAGGQLGQSMGQLTAQTQLAGGQMGIQAFQQAMQNAQFLAQQGMSAEQIAAQTGLTTAQIQQAGITAGGQLGQSMGQLGVQGSVAAGNLQQQALQQNLAYMQNLAQMGLSAEQIAAQTGLSAEQVRQAGITTGMQAATNLGSLGLQGGAQTLQGADLLRTLGATQAQMAGQEFDIYRQAGLGSFAGAEALGTLGSRQLQQAELSNALQGSDINRLLSFGTLQQGQRQLGMDVDFQNQMRQWSAPMQQTQWLGDFVRGFPSGQSTTAMTSQSQPGWGQQLLGAGIAGLGLAAGKSNFGFGS